MFQTAGVSPLQPVSHFPAGSRSTGSVQPVIRTPSVCCRWSATCPGLSSSTSVCLSPSQPMTAVWSSPQRRKHLHTWVRAIKVWSLFTLCERYATFIDWWNWFKEVAFKTVSCSLSVVFKVAQLLDHYHLYCRDWLYFLFIRYDGARGLQPHFFACVTEVSLLQHADPRSVAPPGCGPGQRREEELPGLCLLQRQASGDRKGTTRGEKLRSWWLNWL